jgi:hypothetical protein
VVDIDPDLVGALLAVAAGVLVVAGLAKLLHPAAAAAALAATGLPGGAVAVRAAAAVEVGVGLLSLLRPTAAACIALAVVYLGLAAFVRRAWRAPEPPASCGCAGSDRESPPHPLHAAIDLLLGAAGVTAALTSPTAPLDLAAGPAEAVVLVLGLGAAVALVLAALETLPAVLFAYHPVAPGGGR